MTIPGVAPFALESGFWASFCSGSSSVTLMLVPVTGDPPRVEIQLAGKTVGLLSSTTADPTGHLAAAATSIGQPPQLLVPNPSPPGGFDGAAPSPRTRRLAWWSTCRFTTTQRSPLWRTPWRPVLDDHRLRLPRRRTVDIHSPSCKASV